MPTNLARARVEARPGVALPYGLFSASTVIPVDGVHEEHGVDWLGMACGPTDLATWCLDSGDDLSGFPEDITDGEKTFNPPEFLSAPSVGVYAGVNCSAGGWSNDEGNDRAKAILNVGEQAALERWTWYQQAVGASDVTPVAGDSSVVGALAALEGALAGVTGAVGVIHVPASLAAFFSSSGLTYKDGSKIRTLAGHLVSIGAGYPGTGPFGADEPGSGELFLMATGQVTVRQGEILNPTNIERQAINTRNNDRYALVERVSVVQVECGAFFALAQKSCCAASAPSGS